MPRTLICNSLAAEQQQQQQRAALSYMRCQIPIYKIKVRKERKKNYSYRSYLPTCLLVSKTREWLWPKGWVEMGFNTKFFASIVPYCEIPHPKTIPSLLFFFYQFVCVRVFLIITLFVSLCVCVYRYIHTP